jgi:hypothetical protein
VTTLAPTVTTIIVLIWTLMKSNESSPQILADASPASHDRDIDEPIVVS